MSGSVLKQRLVAILAADVAGYPSAPELANHEVYGT